MRNNIKKTFTILVIFYLSFFYLDSVWAEDNVVLQKINWLQGIAYRYEGKKQEAEAQLQRCLELIENSKHIINAARQEGNQEAEQKAMEALRLAEKSAQKYKKKKLIAEMSIAHMRNFMANLSESDLKGLHYVVAEYRGDVMVKSPNEDWTPLTINPNSQPKPGATIMTGKRGRVKIFMFNHNPKESPTSVTIGENTVVHLKKAEKKLSQYEKVRLFLKKGMLYLDEKVEEMREKIMPFGDERRNFERSQRIKEWEECVQTYGIDSLKCIRMYDMIPEAFSTRIVGGAIRGTKVAVWENELKGTEIFVLEGSVLISNKKGNEVRVVDAGYSIRISPQGEIFPLKKIDLSTISKWWEE